MLAKDQDSDLLSKYLQDAGVGRRQAATLPTPVHNEQAKRITLIANVCDQQLFGHKALRQILDPPGPGGPRARGKESHPWGSRDKFLDGWLLKIYRGTFRCRI